LDPCHYNYPSLLICHYNSSYWNRAITIISALRNTPLLTHSMCFLKFLDQNSPRLLLPLIPSLLPLSPWPALPPLLQARAAVPLLLCHASRASSPPPLLPSPPLPSSTAADSSPSPLPYCRRLLSSPRYPSAAPPPLLSAALGAGQRCGAASRASRVRQHGPREHGGTRAE
jgi:hypothetical protein